MTSLQTQHSLNWKNNLLFYLFILSMISTSLSLSSLSASSTTQKRVVVVGAGVGGLATAARIATATSNNCEVLVLEKNSYSGGRCGSFQVETDKGFFRHERGPSLLLLKDVYENLFEECRSDVDKNAQDYGLQMNLCTPAYQVVFDDGDRIELGFSTKTTDLISKTKFEAARQKSRQKMDSYEPHGSKKWDEYMEVCAAFLECGLPNFIEERLDFEFFPAFIGQALRGFGKYWPLKPHSGVLDAAFTSQKMKVMASFQNLYVGLEPYRNQDQIFSGVLRKTAPAVFGLLAAIELHESTKNAGVYAPVGGFEAVTKAIEKLAVEKGVKIECDSTVTKVNEHGVYVGSRFIPADLVLINADLPFATKTLISNEDTEERYDWNDQYDFSSGVIAFHWSIDKNLSELNTHNVFLIAENQEKAESSWRVVREDKSIPNESMEPFNFYVHRASKVDPTAAPEGCDAIMVLVPAPTLSREPSYVNLPRQDAIDRYKQQFGEAVVSKARQAVLKRLAALESLRDLEKHIIHETVDTPGSYADLYNVAAGTPFALSHGFAQLSLARPGAESSSLPNVLFVGASSRPGNGVPLVLIGAKLVAEKALKILSMETGRVD